MLNYKINYNGRYTDELIIQAETIEEIRKITYEECNKRNWDASDCWSEQM